MQQPNTRLKLTVGDRFNESGVLCAGANEQLFNDTAPAGESARSLSAIR